MLNIFKKNFDFKYIIILLFVSVFILIYIEDIFLANDINDVTSETTLLKPDEIYEQHKIFLKKANVKSVYVNLTYDDVSQGSVNVIIYKNDEIIKHYCANITDFSKNTMTEVPLDSEVVFEQGDLLNVVITTDCGNNIYLKNGENIDYQDFFISGKLSDKAINYGVKINCVLEKNICLLMCLAVVGLVVVLNYFNVNEHNMMTILLISIGIIYMFVSRENTIPDERVHLLRSYDVSQGHFIPEYILSGKEVGGKFPYGVLSYADKTANLEFSSFEEYDYSNDAMYSPLNYFPQALAMYIARLFTSNMHFIYYAGRWGNFIVSLAMMLLALKIIPFGKRALFTIMSFPMTLQQMVSISPDCLTNATVMLFISYIMYLKYSDNVIKMKEITNLILLCVLLSQCKIVYIIMACLIMIVPNEKFVYRKKGFLIRISIVMISFLVAIICMRVGSQFMTPLQPGVDGKTQILRLLEKPFNYFSILLKTIFVNGFEFYISSMFGVKLGALRIETPSCMWIVCSIIFIYAIISENSKQKFNNLGEKVVVLGCFTFAIILIFTSLYVGWTPVGRNVIEGVQGRYFIPIIFLLVWYYLCGERKLYLENKNNFCNKYIYLGIVFTNVLAVISIYGYVSS